MLNFKDTFESVSITPFSPMGSTFVIFSFLDVVQLQVMSTQLRLVKEVLRMVHIERERETF